MKDRHRLTNHFDTTSLCRCYLTNLISYFIRERMTCNGSFPIPSLDKVSGSLYLTEKGYAHECIHGYMPKSTLMS